MAILLLVQVAAQAGTGAGVLDFQVTDLNGRPSAAAALQGRVVLLDFWAVWCPPCIEAFPVLSRLRREFRARDLEILGVAVHSGSLDDVRRFLEGRDVRYRVVLGTEELTERFEVIGYPTYFLVGRDGKIHKQYVGIISEFYEELRADIAMLAERPALPLRKEER